MTEKEFKNLKIGDSIYYFFGFDSTINIIIIEEISIIKSYVYINPLIFRQSHFLDDFEISEKKCLLNYLKRNNDEILRNKYSEFIKQNLEYFI